MSLQWEAMAKIEPSATAFDTAYGIMVTGLETLPGPEANNAVGGGLNVESAVISFVALALSGLVQNSRRG